jgi:membrane associated rhomboid family serine protease
MGIQDRDYYREYHPPWYSFTEHKVTKGLIAINIAVYVVQVMVALQQEGMGQFTELLEMSPQKVFLEGEVWRLLTAAFLHHPQNLFHIVFNMLMLWWFGREMEELYGPKEFLAFYLLGGILGNLAWGGTQFLVDPQSNATALGASGAVMAVLVLAACHYPTMTVVLFFIPAPLWLMALVYVGLDAFYFMASIKPGMGGMKVAVAAHLGGAAWAGVYYYFQLRLVGWWKDWSFRRRRRPALKIYRAGSADDEPFAPKRSRPSVSPSQEQLEAKLDAVLAKMAREGKEKLSPEELAILQQASEIYRRRKA